MSCICLARGRNQVREPRRRCHAPARMRNARKTGSRRRDRPAAGGKEQNMISHDTLQGAPTGTERRLGLSRSQPMRPAHPAAARIVRGGGFAKVADGKEIR